MNFESALEELINLLLKASEKRWANYFTEALYLHENDKKNASYDKVIGAYGGMGSFNDIALNFISDEEYERVLELKSWIYNYSRRNRKNIFGF